jgi:UDP-N-acetylmuramyl pentapeptide phosphotransferase/UDP-N-acetylglucosamine-1-phosphate transferase
MLTLIAVVAAALSAGLILLLSPWLRTYALARPNARSSHLEPTPQGGGGAVIVATFAVVWAGALISGSAFTSGELGQFGALTAGAALLAVAGAIDDIRPLAPPPRLLLQGVAAAIVIAALPEGFGCSLLPWWGERALLLLAGVWFVNLTNFMDGIDLTVAGSSVAAAIVAGVDGQVSWLPAMVALALGERCSALRPSTGRWRGFSRRCRQPADRAGLAWLLQVAGRGELAAALILPLYYVADATLTLLRRLSPVSRSGRRTGRILSARALRWLHRARDRRANIGINLVLAVLAIAAAGYEQKPVGGAADRRCGPGRAAALGFARGKPDACTGHRRLRLHRAGIVNELAAQGIACAPPCGRPPTFPRSVRWSRCPTGASDQWRPLIRDIDAVVHLAGIAHAGRHRRRRVRPRQPRGDHSLARREAALRASSASSLCPRCVRKRAGVAARAHRGRPPRPTDAYGHSKLAAEDAVRAAHVPYTILRPALICGPDVRTSREPAAVARWPVPLPLGALRSRRSLLARKT